MENKARAMKKGIARSWSAILLGFLFVGTLCAPPGAQGQSFIWPLSGSTDGSAPLDRLNSPFGPRIRASTNSYEFHEGIRRPHR